MAATGASGASGFSKFASSISTASVGKAISGIGSQLDTVFSKLTAVGKQGQWVGRQLTSAFTVPVAAVAGLGVDVALKQSQAFSQLAANYGAVGSSAAQNAADLKLLDQAITDVSDKYGISVVTLDAVATAYAKAGASGAQLAEDVANTAQVMVISGDDTADVANKLIGLQEAYHLSASQMQDAIEQMIVVSKDGPVSFDDLAEAMRTSAGAAAESGIPIGELADLVLALAPAAGDATTAGNALRTIISRLANPSADYVKLLQQMGINTSSVAWESSGATQKLEIMAQAMNGLTGAQKAAVDSAASSRFQIDRFSVLISDLQAPLGNYSKALGDTSDKTKVMTQYNQELESILSSNAGTFKILWQQLQNALVQVVVPLLPALEGLVGMVLKLIDAFNSLSPQTQQWVLLGVLFLAATGPVLRYASALIELVGVFGRVLALGPRMIGWLVASNGQLASLAKYPIQALGNAVEGSAGALAAATADIAVTDATILADTTATAGAVTTEWVTAGTYSGLAGGFAAAGWAEADAAILVENAATMEALTAESAIGGAEAGAAGGTGFLAGFAELISGGLAAIGGLFTEGGFFAGIGETLGEIGAAIGGVFGPDEIALIIAGAALWWTLIYNAISHVQAFVSGFGQFIVDVFTGSWGALPGIVGQAIKGVISILEATVGDIKDLLSYLDPFAHHSPSLVDNVQDGLDVVAGEYGNLTGSGGVYEQAQSAHDTFVSATQPSQAATQAKQRQEVLSGNGPAAASAYDQQAAALAKLEDVLTTLTADYDAQKEVVAQWKQQLDAAAASLSAAQNQLSLLQKAADATSSALSAAKTQLTDLVNTPLTGMQAMSDQIFANTQAQKQLQLQMDQLQDINGVYEDLTQAAANYQGELEQLEARQTSLREAGAGSDVLGPINDQIASLQGQQGDIASRVSQITDLNNQLTQLQHTGDELSLQQSIMFDPLTRQLQEASTAMAEVPFDTLLAQVTATKANVDQLTTTYDAQTAAVAAQQAVVDQLDAAHTAIQTTYDAENQKLSDLNDAYTGVSQAIQQMQSDMASAASGASSGKGPALDQTLKNFAAGGADQNPGSYGLGDLPNTDDLGDLVKNWTDQLQSQFGNFDIFAPIKKKFQDFKSWVKGQLNLGTLIGAGIGVGAGPIGIAIGAALGDVISHQVPTIERALGTAWRASIAWLDGIWHDIWDPIAGAWTSTMNTITGAFKTAWGAVSGAAQAVWGDVLKPVFDAIDTVLNYTLIPAVKLMAAVYETAWNDIIGPIVRTVWNDFLSPVFSAIEWTFVNVLPPVLEVFGELFEIVFFGIADIIEHVWNDLVYPALHAFWDFITNDLGPTITWLWNNIVVPYWNAIGTIISFVWNNVVHPVLSAFDTFFHAVLGPTFSWLWNNIVSPIWSGIGTEISFVWNNIVKPVLQAFDGFFHNVLAPTFTWFRDTIVKPVMDGIGDAISTVWTGILNALNFAIDRAIDIFNAIASAINWIGSKIPGVNISITGITYPKFATSVPNVPHAATGAVLGEVGPGFVTNGIRAIVGEGNPHYPEYVIPTDPAHRSNALNLLQGLVGNLGVQQLAAGGVVSGVFGPIGDIAGDIAGAAGAALDGIKDFAEDVLNKGFDLAVKPIISGLDTLIDNTPQPAWAQAIEKGVITEFFNDIKSHLPGNGAPGAGNSGGVSIESIGGSSAVANQNIAKTVIPSGWTQGDEWSALLKLWNRESGWNQYAKNASSGAYGIPQALPPTKMPFAAQQAGGSSPAAQIGWGASYIGGRYGDPLNAWAHETAIGWYGSGGRLPVSVYDNGGLLPPGFTLAYNGTGKGEKVLTAEQAGGNHTTTLNFYGDLAFPNITDPDDAEEFISNLEALA